ncbi:uncharacterized protein V1510DRAFT_417794 [Dipodascopsis tothii]|uniref:uncharacterized protein n=1 Tax=Dipodascopsis tothii TaxID=44089 RepID=UPI0034CFE478
MLARTPRSLSAVVQLAAGVRTRPGGLAGPWAWRRPAVAFQPARLMATKSDLDDELETFRRMLGGRKVTPRAPTRRDRPPAETGAGADGAAATAAKSDPAGPSAYRPAGGRTGALQASTRPAGPRAARPVKPRPKKPVVNDPYFAAEKIKRILERDRVADAEALAIGARTKGTVCWNYIIDHQLEQGRVMRAFKTFADMRRRACTPNEQTYTILFRGLAQNAPQVQSATSRTVSLVEQLAADDSRVKLNVVHLNAALRVAEAAQSADTAWKVLEHADGVEPDARTFTALLRTVCKDEDVSARDKYDIGQRILDDVREREKRGLIELDVPLYLAIERALTHGQRNPHEDEYRSLDEALGASRAHAAKTKKDDGL